MVDVGLHWGGREQVVVSAMELKSSVESVYDSLTISTAFIMVPIISPVAAKTTSAAKSDDFFGFFCVLVIFIRNYLRVRLCDWVWFKSLHIYMDTGFTVVIAYVLLLVINVQYSIIIPFPISLVSFIAYLCNEKLQQNGSGLKDKDSKEIGKLERTVVIPYFMLLISAKYGDGSPVLSHFLLFSCCALGTLALLYSRLADEVPALTPALECIQMAYMVMLFITVHTMVAEWLGEVTALVCMPELIAGLVWFSTLLHSDRSNRAVDKVTSETDDFVLDCSRVTEVPGFETVQASTSVFEGFILNGSMFIPLGAVLASLTSTYAYDGELLASWYMEATAACVIAGCMPNLGVWMISRWPGSIPGSDKATRLLKFAANICLTRACLMLFGLLAGNTMAYGSVLKYIPDIYFSIAVAWLVSKIKVAWLVALFVKLKHLAGALRHIY